MSLARKQNHNKLSVFGHFHYIGFMYTNDIYYTQYHSRLIVGYKSENKTDYKLCGLLLTRSY